MLGHPERHDGGRGVQRRREVAQDVRGVSVEGHGRRPVVLAPSKTEGKLGLEEVESLPLAVHCIVKRLAHGAVVGAASQAATPDTRLVVHLQASNCDVRPPVLAPQACACFADRVAALVGIREASILKLWQGKPSLALGDLEIVGHVEDVKGLPFATHEVVKWLAVRGAVGVAPGAAAPHTRLAANLEAVCCRRHGTAVLAAQAAAHVCERGAAARLLREAGHVCR
mmetsp:Transcript_33281/g.103753  ORF Transcript_33281/g.103753 Transcript_33281/m.103753 type:complete len:226 (+) Transcript_33281:1695-2372(+)